MFVDSVYFYGSSVLREHMTLCCMMVYSLQKSICSVRVSALLKICSLYFYGSLTN